MGHFDVDAGPQAPGCKLMMQLVADGAWVKLSGAYRLSKTPPYADTIPFARSLIEVAPDRCVWGSDWPHVGFWGPMPNVGDLLDLVAVARLCVLDWLGVTVVGSQEPAPRILLHTLAPGAVAEGASVIGHGVR